MQMRWIEGSQTLVARLAILLSFVGALAWAWVGGGCRGGSKSSSRKRVSLERLQGKGFSFLIPRKFAKEKEGGLSKKTAARGGAALFAIGRKNVPNAFRGSIVVLPIPPDGKSWDKYDGTKQVCTEILPAMKQIVGTVRMVDLPMGRFCQIVGANRDNKTHGTTFTFLKQKGVDRAWGFTCNFDPRDDIAQKACNQALRSWRFEK